EPHNYQISVLLSSYPVDWGFPSIDCTDPTFFLHDDQTSVSVELNPGETIRCTFTMSLQDEPPLIDVHQDVTAEATGPGGANVNYVLPTAFDSLDGPLPVACLPAPGSLFPLGPTTVNCSAEDSAGNEDTSSFDVHVQDTTPPTINVPADMTVPAAGPDGTIVDFNATATDAVDGTTPADCAPPSGSLFPAAPDGLGNVTTTVTCNRTDAHGNAAAATTFDVTVEGGLDQITDLQKAVGDSTIDKGLRTDLGNKLRDALKELNKTKPGVKQACRKLDEFIAKVVAESKKKKPKIDAATAAAWLVDARQIKSVLGC
ncbi:MAG: HYR domain-containing protein, partial [Actinomycetota bacterium]